MTPSASAICPVCGQTRLAPAFSGTGQYLGCGDCGFVFRVRQGAGDTRALQHHYEKTDPHQRVAASREGFYTHALNHLEKALPKSSRKILDVGCGHGHFLAMAAKRGWEVWGVDLTEQAAQNARQLVGRDRVFTGVVSDLPQDAGSFDAITLWDVLMYPPDPVGLLTQCHQRLVPGGMMGLRVRNFSFQKGLAATYGLLEKIARPLGINNPAVFQPNGFHPASLRLAIRKAGFDSMTVEPSPLTKGDPYQSGNSDRVVALAKNALESISRGLFLVSSRRMIFNPSLLAWAGKAVRAGGAP